MGSLRCTRTFVAAVALVALPRVAVAMCAEPAPFAAPAGGATIPPRATVYVFVPPSQSPSAVGGAPAPTIDVAGDGDLSWRIEPGPGPTGIPVYGVAIRTTGRRVTISVHGNQRDALGPRSDANPARAFTYVVDPGWRAPATPESTILDATWDRSSWTCL